MGLKLKQYKESKTNHHASTQNLDEIYSQTGNLYRSISIIGKRSNQIANELRIELQDKLETFVEYVDSIEEITENREQIEVSKFYEKLPHATLLATTEFLDGQTAYRKMED
jgi:hypothetical protein